MGAKFLNDDDVASAAACMKLCCETNECDVFIYEEKVNIWGRATKNTKSRIENKLAPDMVVNHSQAMLRRKSFYERIERVVCRSMSRFTFAMISSVIVDLFEATLSFSRANVNSFNRKLNDIEAIDLTFLCFLLLDFWLMLSLPLRSARRFPM